MAQQEFSGNPDLDRLLRILGQHANTGGVLTQFDVFQVDAHVDRRFMKVAVAKIQSRSCCSVSPAFGRAFGRVLS